MGFLGLEFGRGRKLWGAMEWMEAMAVAETELGETELSLKLCICLFVSPRWNGEDDWF